MKTKTRCSILLLVSALLISGCAHYPVNAPLRSANPESGYRFQTVARTNCSRAFRQEGIQTVGRRPSKPGKQTAFA
jgi:PBP1b-binding outer membrane lipoprotein LpoB